jgi:hypothetical protein
MGQKVQEPFERSREEGAAPETGALPFNCMDWAEGGAPAQIMVAEPAGALQP